MQTSNGNSVGIAIEGVGDDASKTGGRVYYYGEAPQGSTVYDWNPSLVAPPGEVEFRVNPFTGRTEQSTLQLTLRAGDVEIADFFTKKTRTEHFLDAAITDSATQITIVDRAGAAVTTYGANDLLWVGDEAFKVTSHAGAGVYNVTRELFGTSAAAIPEGFRIWTVNPHLRRRVVRLVERDHEAAADSVVWLGYLDNWPTNKEGTQISVTARDFESFLQNARVGFGSRDLRPFCSAQLVEVRSGRAVAQLGLPASYRSTVFKTGRTSSEASFQLGDTMVTTSFNFGANGWQMEAFDARWLGSSFAYEDDGKPTPLDEKAAIFELLTIIRDKTAKTATRGLTYPYHPLAIWMAFATSTNGTAEDTSATSWDCLGSVWGLGLPAALFDTSAISALIEDTSHVMIDQLVLGWDGEPVSFDLLDEVLLKPWGFFRGRTQDGLITFQRLEALDVEEFETAKASPVTVIGGATSGQGLTDQLVPARSSGTSAIQAKVGELPWQKPRLVYVFADDNQQRDSIRRTQADKLDRISLDFRTVGAGVREQFEDADVFGQAIQRAALAGQEIPFYVCRVEAPALSGVSYDVGAVVNLAQEADSPTFILSTGARGEPSGSIDATGYIVGARRNIQNESWTLTVLCVNRGGAAIQWRAPAAELASTLTAGNTTCTMEERTFHPNTTNTDNLFFTAGDDVEWWTPDGQRITTTPQVNSVDSVSGAATVELSASYSGDIPAGSILRLAERSQYSNSSVVSGSSNPYAYFADVATGDLGTSGDDPNLYG